LWLPTAITGVGEPAVSLLLSEEQNEGWFREKSSLRDGEVE
jgi:hypothetical protein